MPFSLLTSLTFLLGTTYMTAAMRQTSGPGEPELDRTLAIGDYTTSCHHLYSSTALYYNYRPKHYRLIGHF
jgi:hypothetical protein